MLRAFIRLAIVLAREAKLHQFLAHGIGANRITHCRLRLSELVHALRYPDQGPHGIAEDGRLDEALELGHKLRIRFGNGPAPATRATNLALRQRLRVEIVLSPRLIVERASPVIRATTDTNGPKS